MLLYYVNWPKQGTVHNINKNFSELVIQDYKTHVVFNKYLWISSKSNECQRCSVGKLCPDYKCDMDSVLPVCDAVLKTPIKE